MSKHYDYFVIGAGSGGVRSARVAGQHGAKVGIAEYSALGGTCVNVGCVPKKLMAYASDYGPHFEDARGFGWDVPKDIPFDWNTLIENKNKEILRLNGAYKKTLDGANVEIINGFAKFIDEKTVEVDGKKITADKFLIATGGTPRKPSIEGGEHMITSDEIFFWEHPPKRVVIVGGGYIAVEFAHILHGIGAHVTLLYRKELFLRSFDTDIREALAEEMLKQGIDLRFNTDITKIEKNGEKYSVYTTDDDILECDLPMAAIGRVPKTEGLGLEDAGIETDKSGHIKVNDYYQTSQAHIYALGDVAKGIYNLTPVAIKEGHVLADNLFSGGEQRHVNYNNIATAIFSQPPISTVGFSEDEARSKGHDVTVYKSDFKPMKHTLSGRDERTFMKLVVDNKTDCILGMHMMGLDAPEIMQGFSVALNCRATKADFDRTMAIHPTAAEEFVTMK